MSELAVLFVSKPKEVVPENTSEFSMLLLVSLT